MDLHPSRGRLSVTISEATQPVLSVCVVRDATRQEVDCWRRGDVGGPQLRARPHMIQPRAALTTQHVQDRGSVCVLRGVMRRDAMRCEAMRQEERRQIEIIEAAATARPQHRQGRVHGPEMCTAAVLLLCRTKARSKPSTGTGDHLADTQVPRYFRSPGPQNTAALPWRAVDFGCWRGAPGPALAHP